MDDPIDTRRRSGPTFGVPRWCDQHPFAADTILAIVLAAVSIAFILSAGEAVESSDLNQPTEAVQWLILIGPTLPVAFRRIRPSAAVVAGGLLQAVVWLNSFPDYYIATAILIYSAAALGGQRGRRAAWTVAVALTVFTGIGYLTDSAPIYAVAVVGLFGVAAASFGAGVASRAAYTAAVEARAREAERTQLVEQDRALSEERNRIARELHDVVAHGLSVIVVQASAAQRILGRDPDGAKTSLEQIEQVGRTALAEMRQVLNVVRTDPSESWRPAPGLVGLNELVVDLAATGLKVDVELDPTVRRGIDAADGGDHPGALPVTVDMTAYRIVQESLTNVLKHGGPGVQAKVKITRGARSLDLSIADNGRGAAAADRGGHGLQGMRERVDVFGGTFEARPRPGGGFAVHATLPIDNRVLAAADQGDGDRA